MPAGKVVRLSPMTWTGWSEVRGSRCDLHLPAKTSATEQNPENRGGDEVVHLKRHHNLSLCSSIPSQASSQSRLTEPNCGEKAGRENPLAVVIVMRLELEEQPLKAPVQGYGGAQIAPHMAWAGSLSRAQQQQTLGLRAVEQLTIANVEQELIPMGVCMAAGAFEIIASGCKEVCPLLPGSLQELLWPFWPLQAALT